MCHVTNKLLAQKKPVEQFALQAVIGFYSTFTLFLREIQRIATIFNVEL
jgi:hypothetical protein